MAHQFINIPSGYIWDEKQATEELARVLEAASRGERMPYVAGSRSITDTLKNPDELAANYPMNAANEQIGLAGSTGYKVPGAGGRTLFDILQAGDAMAAGKMAPGFQTSVGQSLTGETPSEINLRGAQAANLRAQTGELGGPAVDQQSKLFKSLGTDSFAAVMNEELNSRRMKPSEISMWAEKDAAKRKATTPDSKQLGVISMAKDSYNQIDALQQSFRKTDAYKTGKMSKALVLALSRSSVGGQAFNEAMGNLTPDEYDFVAKANLAQSRLRQLAGAGALDAHFSNYDAGNAETGIGRIAGGPVSYDKQLSVFKDDVASRFNNALQTMSSGPNAKNVSSYGRLAISNEPKAGEYTLLTTDGKPITVRGPKEAVEKAIADGKYKRSKNY